jgi:hypothetical protein
MYHPSGEFCRFSSRGDTKALLQKKSLVQVFFRGKQGVNPDFTEKSLKKIDF